MNKSYKKIVALTGAGISAESGITTFRDSGGLWEQYDVMTVASIDGWYADKALVQQFYNRRRADLEQALPNEAHRLLAGLEAMYSVTVVTQNVDDLHERAGSSDIIHLHGELTKACSENDKSLVTEIGYRPIADGEKAADGALLRPFIVWFGEAVPMMEAAARAVAQAELLLVIGTSLNVYPAAGLVDYASKDAKIILIDPNDVNYHGRHAIEVIKEKATLGMKQIYEELMRAKEGQ